MTKPVRVIPLEAEYAPRVPRGMVLILSVFGLLVAAALAVLILHELGVVS